MEVAAVPSRRKSRYDKLMGREADRVDADARRLQRTIADVSLHLTTSGDTYRALRRLGDEIQVTLNIVHGRPANFEEPWIAPGAMPGDPGRVK